MTCHDWIDPFAEIIWALVRPHPGEVHSQVHAHLVLVQHPAHQRSSVVVAFSDAVDDPWHPRLPCLTVPADLSHNVLKEFIDLDDVCQRRSDRYQCHTYWGDRDMT